jgi:hypothetical protein
LRPLEPLPQAPQSRYPAAADPGPMNPEDNWRLSVYPHVEVELTADVCPSGPSRDAGDQGRDGRVIWAGSRPEPARQGRGRGRSFDSGFLIPDFILTHTASSQRGETMARQF